ncbi:hypothetical protein Scep_025814 [Stephania cephalantha]|uniref:Uncharacterized protein n=1 Tax=Stephania cephalantha TaxID=152367 RepID=A0AAP0EIW8_9MAGN
MIIEFNGINFSYQFRASAILHPYASLIMKAAAWAHWAVTTTKIMSTASFCNILPLY